MLVASLAPSQRTRRKFGRLSWPAVIETVISVVATIAIGLLTGSWMHLAIAAAIAPFLLLRTAYSTRLGKRWFELGIVHLAKSDRLPGLKGRESFKTILKLMTSWLATGLYYVLLVCFAGMCRVAATATGTVLRPLTSLRAIPRNWYRIAFCLAITKPPELVPGIRFIPHSTLVRRIVAVYGFWSLGKIVLVGVFAIWYLLFGITMVLDIVDSLKDFQVGFLVATVFSWISLIVSIIAVNYSASKVHTWIESVGRVDGGQAPITFGCGSIIIWCLVISSAFLVISLVTVDTRYILAFGVFPSIILMSVMTLAGGIHFIAYLFRWSLKSTFVVWSPVIFAIHRNLDSLLSANEELTTIRKSAISRVSRYYALLVVVLGAIKLGIFVVMTGVSRLGVSVREARITQYVAELFGPAVADRIASLWQPVVDYFIQPTQLPLWQIVAVVNALLTWGLYLYADYALFRLSTAKPWNESTIKRINEIVFLCRDCLSFYVIACSIYIWTKIAFNVEWPAIEIVVFPWQAEYRMQ